MIELLKKTKIDFMGKKYYAFVLSGIIFILGIIAVVQIARGTANLGIDRDNLVRCKMVPPFHAIRDSCPDKIRKAFCPQ